MLTDQKLRDILKNVWNPKIDLTNSRDIEQLDQLVQQIYTLLGSRDGSAETLAEFLKITSIQNDNAEISDEKSVHTAKLIAAWYFPIEAKWTDYGRVNIQRSVSRFVDQDYIVYQNDTLKEYIPFGYSVQNQIEICFEKIDLPENEKNNSLMLLKIFLNLGNYTFYLRNVTKRIKISRDDW